MADLTALGYGFINHSTGEAACPRCGGPATVTLLAILAAGKRERLAAATCDACRKAWAPPAGTVLAPPPPTTVQCGRHLGGE